MAPILIFSDLTTVPEDGLCKLESILIKVVLPAPLFPINP